MQNGEFRQKLNELLEQDEGDKEIVKYVLNHAWNRWPHAFDLWLYKKLDGYDQF